MRKRMIDPDFWLDEDLAKLSAHARLLYVGSWGICDDNFATFPNRPDWIKAQIFPYEKVDTRRLLDELSKQKKLVLFVENGQEFWFVRNFFKYQRVDRPSKAKYPEFKPENAVDKDILAELSTSARPEVKLSKAKLSKDKGSATPEFEDFWSVYPNKVAKKKAIEVWNRIDPSPELAKKIIEAVKIQAQSEKWTKDDGKFIPHPTTWLNAERWNDEPIKKPKVAGGKFGDVKSEKI